MTLSYVLSAGEAEHGPNRRAVGSPGASNPGTASQGRRPRQTLARFSRCPKRHPLDTSYRSTLEGPTRALPALPDLPPPLPEVDRARSSRRCPPSVGRRPRRTRGDRPLGVLHRRHLRRGQKGGSASERPSGAKVRRSWRFQTALLFLSPSTQRVLRRTRSPLSKRLSPRASRKRSLDV